MIECVITGANFVGTDGRWCRGDLFQHEGTFVFNSVIDGGTMGPLWQDGPVPPEHRNLIGSGRDYFERRGVFVLKDTEFYFNKAAGEYLAS